MTLDIIESDMPQDEAPSTSAEQETGWFNPEYPYSTEEHPFGFYTKPNGETDFNRPRKRRPNGPRGSTSVTMGKGVASDKTARTAAVMLSRLNGFVGLGLAAFGMPMTRAAMQQASADFEEMAYQALLTDPKLCKKILSAGASSGQAQLKMAYLMLGGSIAPTAMLEIKNRRKEVETDAE